MDDGWITASRVVLVAGKGGVGSSTVAAAVSLAAARRGADVLLVAVDGKPGTGTLLGGPPLSPEEAVLVPRRRGSVPGQVRGRTIPPEQAFADYLDLKGAGSIIRRAAAAASLDVVAASTPGLEHLLVLGKIKELERTRAADLIVVDAPPAGHAAPFIRSAAALQDVIASGPVRTQADEVAAMLADPDRTQAVLVTLPEETPVTELVELAYDVEERIGLQLGPLVVNCCWPDRPGLATSTATAAAAARITLDRSDRRALSVSSAYGRSRLAVQREQIARLDEELPLPRIELPRLATPRLTPTHVSVLADALAVAPRVPA